jgi:H+-transporting ATPase
VVAAFGLFYLGERVFHLDRAHIQTLMYLKLSVAGHLTIFLTRTRGPFWSIRPARALWIAVLGTQAVATLIAVYGLFMTPLGWGWAGLVWGYALVWFLINDRIKLLAYRIFDPVTSNGGSKAADELRHETKAVEPTAESKRVTNATSAADLTPRIAKRAYALYEEGGRKDGAALQNWQKAESEVRLDLAKAEPARESRAEPKSAAGGQP